MPLIQWAVPNVAMQSSGDVLPQRGQLRRLLFSSQLWRLNVSVLLLHMMITLLFVQLPVTLVHFDLTLDSHWMLYLPVLVASVIGLVILMGIGKGQTPRKVVLVAALFMTIAFAMLGAQDHHRWVVVGAVILFFTGFNYLEASFPALVSSIAPAGEKGTAMGIYASFQFFGAFLGGVLAGIVADHWTAETAYFVGAVAASCWLLILRDLNEVNRIKRVAFKWQGTSEDSSALREALSGLAGVQETTFSVPDGMIYLKVTGQFDREAASQLLRRYPGRAA